MEEVKIPETMHTQIKNLIPIEDAVKLFESVQKPPEDALKPIDAGRLKGKNEISPLWRMKVMTEKFGLYGDGWKYEVIKEWKEPVEATREVIVQVTLNLYTRNRFTGEWNAPSPATGSAYLIVKDKNGLHGNENAWASAMTDAIGKACKPYGIGYDVYLGKTNKDNNQNNQNNQNNNKQNNYNQNNYNNQGRNQGNNYRNNYQNNYNKQQYQQQPQNNNQAAANQQKQAATTENKTQQQAQQPQQDNVEMIKRETLAEIMKIVKELQIPTEKVTEIIREMFNKNKTSELSNGELIALRNHLPAKWQEKKD